MRSPEPKADHRRHDQLSGYPRFNTSASLGLIERRSIARCVNHEFFTRRGSSDSIKLGFAA
jgi:hypothetical protein